MRQTSYTLHERARHICDMRAYASTLELERGRLRPFSRGRQLTGPSQHQHQHGARGTGCRCRRQGPACEGGGERDDRPHSQTKVTGAQRSQGRSRREQEKKEQGGPRESRTTSECCVGHEGGTRAGRCVRHETSTERRGQTTPSYQHTPDSRVAHRQIESRYTRECGAERSALLRAATGVGTPRPLPKQPRQALR